MMGLKKFDDRDIKKKPYGLHCFQCGELFYSKEDVIRVSSKPYCGGCVSGWCGPDEDYDEPDEQEMIDEYHRRRYGEY